MSLHVGVNVCQGCGGLKGDGGVKGGGGVGATALSLSQRNKVRATRLAGGFHRGHWGGGGGNAALASRLKGVGGGVKVYISPTVWKVLYCPLLP